MPDESNELRATLNRLHEQLRGAQNISPETQALLRDVVADIQSLVGSTGGTAQTGNASQAGHDSIIARLTTAERDFEATHPTLAGIVGSLIDALGRMGI